MSSIWYVSKYIGLPSAGRGGTRAFLLMREMARRGHRCLMITSDSNHLTNAPSFTGSHMVETIDGVDICWIRTRKYTGAQSLGRVISWIHFEWRLWRLRKQSFARPDAVIVSSLSLLTILNGLLLKRRFGCRLIFEIRDIWPLTLVEEGGFSPRNPFVAMLGFIERLGYRKADDIVGTMPNLRQHVDEQVSAHAPVHSIPFGIDPDMLTGAVSVSDEWIERNVPQHKFIVCHAGTIGTTNALDTLFETARSMTNNADVHFLIVGEGDLRTHYEAMCADLPNVTFTGPVPKTMVQSALSQCDLLYFSALRSNVWKYGMSLNKVVDYMLAAKPILGSYTGFPTMIEEAGAGAIVPAGDVEALREGILRFKAMVPDDRVRIGAKGREWMLTNRLYATLARDYMRIALPHEVTV